MSGRKRIGLLIAGIVLAALAGGFLWARARLKPMLRDRIVAALREQYRRDLEIRELDIALFPFSATGEGLVLQQRNRPGLPPLATIERLTVQASLLGVLREPIRIQRVTLEGLKLNIPPKQKTGEEKEKTKQELPRILIDEVIADGTLLQILPKQAEKEPVLFDISKLTLHSAGTLQPMRFRATLTNPKPPGDIFSTGTFGPWQNEDPSLTAVAGDYTFQNADLSVFKGIAGTLASGGTYSGILERIEVDGWTDTPDFSVDVSGQPVHLKTRFHAIVDGTNGDTYLEPVIANFGRSSVVARGGIYGKPGVKGKTVSLQVELSNSRIEDLLRLAMRGTPIMTGAIAVKTKFELPPGDQDVVDKLSLNGGFVLERAHFTRINVQEKIDELSQRARGKVGKDAEDERVVSNLRGTFVMQNSHIRFSGLNFNVPGATVALGGGYTLHGGALDFKGTLRTEARVSQMTTGVKSFFLKIVDPIFAKNGAGAVIPFKVAGTQEQPKFGLDKGRIFSAK